MISKPLVSVLLLSMNHENYIEQCIKSLKNQTFKNIEIIYLDNSSTDKTFDIGKNLLESSGIPHLIFRNENSQGISKNLNFLLEHSKGEYVSPLSADDWFASENIEKKIDFLLSHKNTGALFSNGWYYYEDLKKTELNNSSGFKRGNIYRDILLHPDCIFYVGIIYRTEVLNEIGKWDENLLIEDYDLLVRLSMTQNIDFLNIPLVYYRRKKGSVSKNYQFMLEGHEQFYQKYKGVKWINMDKWLSERYRRVAANYIDNCRKSDAVPYLKKAFRLNPLGLNNLKTLNYYIRN